MNHLLQYNMIVSLQIDQHATVQTDSSLRTLDYKIYHFLVRSTNKSLLGILLPSLQAGARLPSEALLVVL
jgi:hypothetical protein